MVFYSATEIRNEIRNARLTTEHKKVARAIAKANPSQGWWFFHCEIDKATGGTMDGWTLNILAYWAERQAVEFSRCALLAAI